MIIDWLEYDEFMHGLRKSLEELDVKFWIDERRNDPL